MSVSLGCTENDDDDAEKNDGNDHDEVTDTDPCQICGGMTLHKYLYLCGGPRIRYLCSVMPPQI